MSPHRFEVENKEHLKDEERHQRQPAQEILQRASPTLDEVCADLGCGNGYLTIPLALRSRVVLAVDAQKGMLQDLWQSAGEFERLKIVPVVAELPALPFAGACLDHVFLINVLHELEDRHALAEEVERVLRPGGKLTLVDFQRKKMDFGPPLEERIKEKEAPKFFSSMAVAQKWSFPTFYQYEMIRR